MPETYLWFGNQQNSLPKFLKERCLMCNYTSQNTPPSSERISAPCPECKRRSLVIEDAARYKYYYDFGLEDWTFFQDQYAVPYGFSAKEGKNFHIGDDTFEHILRARYPLYPDKKLSNFISYAKSLCYAGGITQELNYRVAKEKLKIYIDTKTSAHIEIDENGWRHITPMKFFRQETHMKEFVVSEGTKEDFEAYFQLFNFSSDDRLLVEVWAVASLIPDIPHPILLPTGAQGAAKSTMGVLLGHLLDPSAITVMTMPKEEGSILQQLYEHYLIIYDNLTTLSEHQTDIICQATTGVSFSRRKLYTDGGNYFRTYRSMIILNGINLPSTRPDLIDRSILIEMLRIPEDERKMLSEVKGLSEERAPKARGYMLSTLASALAQKEQVINDLRGKLPRMADWAVYAEAVSRALGYPPYAFVEKYNANRKEQTEVVIEGDLIAGYLIKLASDSEEGFSGTPTELLTKIRQMAADDSLPYEKLKQFPQTANSLSRQLKIIMATLAEKKITITRHHDGQKRLVEIKKIGTKGQQVIG